MLNTWSLQKVKEVKIKVYYERLSGFEVTHREGGKPLVTDEFGGCDVESVVVLDDDEVIAGYKSTIDDRDVHKNFQFIIMRDIEAWDL